mmetsp:Transcript_5146/g.13745  ORF Transcript_5146/g.13745 Transcript_5146/m.13745 type:complete len:241 (-) Transcript_5146:2323-3045(-)
MIPSAMSMSYPPPSTPIRSVQPDGPREHLLFAQVRLERSHPRSQLRDARRLSLQHRRQAIDVRVDRAPGLVHVREQRHLAFDQLHGLLDLTPVRGYDLFLLLQNDVDELVVRLDHLGHVNRRTPAGLRGGRLGGGDRGRGRLTKVHDGRRLDVNRRGLRRRRRRLLLRRPARRRRRSRPLLPRRRIRRPRRSDVARSKVPALSKHLRGGGVGILASHARHLRGHLGSLLRLGARPTFQCG